ncbi:MAG: hypothetical protein HQL32_11880 [Planctomycetes bacterium]|nr:hypothetical protein [Planctomycetota bacterium]
MRQLSAIIVILSLLFLVGCQIQGLSGPGKTTTLGYDLSRLERVRSDEHSDLPLHLVVAQAGSLCPDEALLAELRKHPKLFRKITVIPASPELRNLGNEVMQKDPNSIVLQARRLGGDLLYLVGGKIETNSSRTPFSIVDLSIVGRYLAPSNKIQGQASIFGAIISVPSNELIMTVSESLSRSKYSPTVSRHANTDEFTVIIRNDILEKLSKKFVASLSDKSGVTIQPSPSLIDILGQDKVTPKATVYILSDGFHIGLILPYSNIFGEEQYIEIGLGERNWVMGKGWKWMDTIMSCTSASDGVAVVEYIRKEALKSKLNSRRRVWKAVLSEEEFGRMLMILESEMSFQNVLFDGYTSKVIETQNGYNLFHTCHNFALNPLGVTGKGLFDSIPRPAPLLEKRLDRVFQKY